MNGCLEQEKGLLLNEQEAFLGWMRGLEPPTPRITIWCSNQLSYNHRSYLCCKSIEKQRLYKIKHKAFSKISGPGKPVA